MVALLQAGPAAALSTDAIPGPEVACSVEPRSADELVNLWYDPDASLVSTPSTLAGIVEEGDIPDGDPVDANATEAVTALAHEWVACTNAGDLVRIYSLLTTDYAQRERLAASSAEEARDRLLADPVPRAPESAWTIGPAQRARVLPDGRVGAAFEVVGMEQPGIAQTVFVAAEQEAGAWRIDDIIYLAALEPTAPTSGYQVIAEYPHDPGAYTQGLVFIDGTLYEGTGRNGESSLRRVDLETGEVLQSVELDEEHFGEGIAVIGDRIYQLTWQTGTAFVYDRETFALLETFSYTTEGWGLTTDGQRLIMSDGSSRIVFRDPATFAEVGAIDVRDGDMPVSNLNELEYINGEIWANVYQTDRIVRIDPASGAVTGWIDLAGLLPRDEPGNEDAEVLNGIAYDAESGRLFVTGKYWPKLFEIELVPPA